MYEQYQASEQLQRLLPELRLSQERVRQMGPGSIIPSPLKGRCHREITNMLELLRDPDTEPRRRIVEGLRTLKRIAEQGITIDLEQAREIDCAIVQIFLATVNQNE